jgi:hypothetical protein
MEHDAFDSLTRFLTGAQPRSMTRRGITRLLGGLALGGPLTLLGFAEADAKKKPCPPCKKRKHGKCKTKLPNGTPCKGGACDSGRCVAAPATGCVAQCSGKVCGPDGCGGQCGPGCATGCCKDGACVAGNTEATCGLHGETCQACDANSSCPFGECVRTCPGFVESGVFSTFISDPDGLDSIDVWLVNADGSFPGFTPGTKAVVTVTATKIDRSKDAVALLTTGDSLGNSFHCGIRF